MKTYESVADLAQDMGVLVSKMEESIEALLQASVRTAEDPDRGHSQHTRVQNRGSHLFCVKVFLSAFELDIRQCERAFGAMFRCAQRCFS
mmetsp:Transcript_65301/g.173159  ORF Transcript_65301/g.173159 Transcript_65301/m.173159 type:complete len:90 (-) Transcript_65301:248-517(-)